MTIATILLVFLLLFSINPIKPVERVELVEPMVSLFITGEVLESKQIHVHPDAQIKDILNEIEFSSLADLSLLDINQKVYDHMVIHIPKKKEHQCISINTSTIDELTQLKGIGESTAQKIIDYRETISHFIILEDIMNVKGIGQKKFESIKDSICL